jgi:hypothetical protein
MHRAFCTSLFSGSLMAALVSCGTLKPDVNVYGDHPVSWSDVREIERLLPAANIRHSIYDIHMESADRATVSCGPINPREHNPGQMIDFTIFRRHGRWYIDKSSIHERQPFWVS